MVRSLSALLVAHLLSSVVVADTYMVGVDDNFAGATEPAFPSVHLVDSLLDFGTLIAPFDGLPHNRNVPHTFSGLPSGITAATLTFRVRGGYDPGVDTDGLMLSFIDAGGVLFTDAVVWGRTFGVTPGGGEVFVDPDPGFVTPGSVWMPDSEALVTLDLAGLPLIGGGTLDLLPMINANGFLDVTLGDDSIADFFRLEVTSVPEVSTLVLAVLAVFAYAARRRA